MMSITQVSSSELTDTKETHVCLVKVEKQQRYNLNHPSVSAYTL